MSLTPGAPLVAIGADGARAGWLAASLYADVLRPEEATVWETRLHLFTDVAVLADFRDGFRAAVAIDVPIGLPDAVGFRSCDLAARKLLKGRATSVFAPPARYMLEAAGDYPAIRNLVERRRQTEPTAKGLSAQAAGIAVKVAEVDAYVRAHRDSESWLWECHPELSFMTLNDGVPLSASKHSAGGLVARLKLVRQLFPDAEHHLAAAPWSSRDVELSDALDAYAAVSTALACARSEQQVLGDGKRDGEGVLMRMVQ